MRCNYSVYVVNYYESKPKKFILYDGNNKKDARAALRRYYDKWDAYYREHEKLVMIDRKQKRYIQL